MLKGDGTISPSSSLLTWSCWPVPLCQRSRRPTGYARWLWRRHEAYHDDGALPFKARSDALRGITLASERGIAVNLIILVIILMILFGGGGFYYGGPYVGGGLGTVLLIVLIVLLLR